MKTRLHSPTATTHMSCALRLLLPRHARLWASLVVLAAFAFEPRPAQAAVTEAWVHRFSNALSNSVDRSLKVVRDAAGDIIVTGTSDDNASGPDMLTIKYSGADGSVLWQQRQRYSASPDDGNYPRAVTVDGIGNVVVTGSTVHTNNNSESDYYTAKYAAADGALLWEKRGPIGGAKAVAVDASGNVVVTGSTATLKYAAADGVLLWERRSNAANGSNDAAALAVDGNGNVVVTGSSQGDYYTAKYAAADGMLLWEKRYNGPGNYSDEARAVAVDGSGNVVVTGNSNNGEPNYESDYYTAKYAAADGALLWEKRYGGPGYAHRYDEAGGLAVDGNGNVVVTGGSYNDQSSYDYYTAKYAAADGALLWEKRGPANGFAQAVAMDGSGNVVVTGISSQDYYTVKYAAADGTLLWERRSKSFAIFWPAWGWTDAAAVVVDGNGNVVVTGPSFGNEAGKSDYYTAKYAAEDGALLWEQRYNGPAHHESYPTAVAMDRSGNVVVTANSESDFYTAKYAASNGALLWEKRGPGSLAQVVVDDRANVVVTGISNGGASGATSYTAKYAADGALLWEKRGPGGGTQVALDASGNVVVTGSSAGKNRDDWSDYYTAKYAASDGALLWEKRYNGLINGPDRANAVAVDGNGNVVVTGSSATSGTIDRGFSYDYYTAKYAARDGTLLWEKRDNKPANRDPSAMAIAVAVDGNGNVVVTGSSLTSGSVSGYYTAKYAAADGALLWEKRYVPLNGYGATGVAVDGSGNVVVTGESGTLKYAAADGALLWQKRFIAGYGSAVAVDGSGNVVVTGSSFGNYQLGDYSYYTAKYAAKDGALLWEKAYKEPGSFANWVRSHGLALGPNGMVAITGSSNLGISTSDVLTVAYREGLSAVAIAPVPSGVRLSFTGTAGQSYSIQRAPAVTGPWNTINTQTAPASGLIQYEDVAQTQGASFYRTSQP